MKFKVEKELTRSLKLGEGNGSRDGAEVEDDVGTKLMQRHQQR